MGKFYTFKVALYNSCSARIVLFLQIGLKLPFIFIMMNLNYDHIFKLWIPWILCIYFALHAIEMVSPVRDTIITKLNYLR